jgi:ABC-2 type transport system permease protein
MHSVLRIARKEIAASFDQPTGYIFIGVFLAVTLFVFFWQDAFFARNLADVRPLFHGMPLLLAFLVAALTMRLWSEERRAGTLEMLLTAPVPPVHYVLGKFLATLFLVAVALALTLPLPVTVSLLGPLDWGPALAGYGATLFLAAAYIAIGLFVSSRTDNQIVSLILTALICALLYLLGSDTLTSLVGIRAAAILSLLGSGSRFASIERGVIDLRDLYYYVSLTGAFLCLNVLALERLRWAADGNPARHRAWRAVTALAVANFLVGNIWLQQVPSVRADMTEGHVYTISNATKRILGEAREPLLIRGYFSSRTHPLLAPLVPQLEDLLKEYAIAGHGKVRVEIVDPQQNPDAEKEANSRYGIHPVPFQTSSKYQTGVVNSYFNIVVAYGDQYETLGYRDLIEVKSQGDTGLSVALRNPEYEITRSIKKVLYGYQDGGNLFASLAHPVTVHAYVSPADQMPASLAALRTGLDTTLANLKKESGGKLDYTVNDPEADGGALAKHLEDTYGFRPLMASLLDTKTFWFYLTLEGDGRVVRVSLPQSLDAQGIERVIRAGLKQFAQGYLRTIAVYTPNPTPSPELGMAGGGKNFSTLETALRKNAILKDTDLKDGRVPDDADLLLLLAPEAMDDQQIFAVDQFLMKGGTVVVAASPFDVSVGDSVSAHKAPPGLAGWLKHNGLSFADSMVLDPQSGTIPVPVERDVGGYSLHEIEMVDYPYFVDLRGSGMPSANSPTTGLSQLTMAWPSPIAIDAKTTHGQRVLPLLRSSPRSWSSEALDVTPDFKLHPRYGFPVNHDTGAKLLAVALEGRFSSYFADKPSPLLAKTETAAKPDDKTATTGDKDGAKPDNKTKPPAPPVVTDKIDRSPDSARLIVFGSSSFLTDDALALTSAGEQTQEMGPVRLLENTLDWSLEDRDLLALRGRAHFTRLLLPLSRQEQVMWEDANYVLALAGLALVWGLNRLRRRRIRRQYQALLTQGGDIRHA